MTKKEMTVFKQLLLQKKEEIQKEIGHISKENFSRSPREAAGDLSIYAFHMADMASDNYERDFSMDLVTSEHRLMYEIDEALNRIEEGTFGNCENCDKKVSRERLKAVPYARFCRDCQEKEEKKKKRSA